MNAATPLGGTSAASLMQAKHRRYDVLNGWWRIDLERHAIALTGQHALQGATKIRLIREILLAEFHRNAREGTR